MDLIVTPAVLIPRPETEHLIEAVIEAVRGGGQESPPHTNRMRMVDIGTGSGCITLALAKEFADAEIHATDISLPVPKSRPPIRRRLHLKQRFNFIQPTCLRDLKRLLISWSPIRPMSAS